MKVRGLALKMDAEHASLVRYGLPLGDERVELAPLLGRRIALGFDGEIHCVHCGRDIKKTFHQGCCYPCFTSLARTDRCLVRPELCHHAQGACQGLSIRVASSRLESGHVEVALKQHVADKTSWQKMLQSTPEPLDLSAERERVLAAHDEAAPGSPLPGQPDPDAKPVEVVYPVLEHPTKVRSHDLDKKGRLEGTLLGVKGQYLILDTAFINVRKYQGYVLELSDDG